MNYTDHQLFPHYDALWQKALPQVRRGEIMCDELILHKQRDLRRGVAIVARPAPEVNERIAMMLQQLKQLEPDQYAYPIRDMHFTILSFFTANPGYQSKLVNLPAYREAAHVASQQISQFKIQSMGITMTNAALMVQGFPTDDSLDRLRNALRSELSARGLGGDLDQRYRLVTAHNTVLRFCAPLRQPLAFAQVLESFRTTNFGTSTISHLELVLCDWYMSHELIEPLGEYQLV